MSDIHPTAIIHESVKFGENFSLGAFSNISENVVIGNNVTIKDRVRIDPQVKIGNNVFIRGSIVICTDMIIEDYVEFGHGVVCTNHKLLSKWRPWLGDPTTPPYVSRGAMIGAAVTLFPGVKLGKNCMIGMGCTVLKDVPDNAVMAGHPLRQLRIVPEKDRL